MSGLQKSETMRRIEKQLADSVALLKLAKGYVSASASIGGQKLCVEINEGGRNEY